MFSRVDYLKAEACISSLETLLQNDVRAGALASSRSWSAPWEQGGPQLTSPHGQPRFTLMMNYECTLARILSVHMNESSGTRVTILFTARTAVNRVRKDHAQLASSRRSFELFYARGRFVSAVFHWSGCHPPAARFHLAAPSLKLFTLRLSHA